MAEAAAGPLDHDVGLGPPVDRQRGLAIAGLLGVSVVWGSTFSAVKHAVEAMPTPDFLATRFTIAAAIMLALRPGSLRHVHRVTLRHGVPLGLLLGAAYLAQTLGLEGSTAAVAGILTGVLVVIAPFVAAPIVRTRITARVWAALLLGGVAVGVLAVGQAGLRAGEGLVLLGAALLAVHLVGFAACAEVHDLWTLTVVQLLTAATLLAAIAAPDGITAPRDAGVWGAVLLAAVLATAVAFMVQTWAQRRLSPTRVGALLATEPVFAVAVAVWLAGDVLTWQLALAGGLVVTAMVLAELGSARASEGPTDQ